MGADFLSNPTGKVDKQTVSQSMMRMEGSGKKSPRLTHHLIHSLNCTMATSKPSVGDTVWVRSGETKHEEPAIVLELNAAFEEEEEPKEKKKVGDEKRGILIRYFNEVETVVPLDKVRFLGKDDEGGGNGRRSVRRSTRVSSMVRVMDVPVQIDDHDVNMKSNSDIEDNMTLTTQVKTKAATSGRKTATKRKASTEEPTKPDPDQSTLVKKNKSATVGGVGAKKGTAKKPRIDMSEPSSPFFKDKEKAQGKKGSAAKKAPRKIVIVTEEKKENTVSKKKGKKATATAKKAPIDIMTEETEEKVSKKMGKKIATITTKTKRGAKKEVIEIVESASGTESRAGKPDGNGGLDQGSPFVVEYAKSSRATCKRCDVRIMKNEVRVGHRPLFR